MKQIIKTLFLATLLTFITLSLIKFPDQTFEASIRGLNIWWEVVFPSLLPFFIVAELLISFGVVGFIGVLFEPIMRPLFNVPGVGSFAWIMGMASGYPSGAKISTRLLEENKLTKTEAERLLSFTNSSSPLFIFGAVSVGFFHDAKLGILIAASHYVGNTLVGVCMGFYGRAKDNIKKSEQKKGSLIIRAFKEMHQTRVNDLRPFGEIMGDAVLSSIKTLVIVGGFIILFSVLTKLLFLIGLSSFIGGLLQYVLKLFLIPIDLSIPFISGLFEITLGAQMVSQVATESILPKIVIVSFILGFNGLSVQAQVSSIIAKTNIRFLPYFFSRIIHGIFASILTVVLYKPLYLNRQTASTQDITVSQEVKTNYSTEILNILKLFGPLLTITSLATALIIIYRKSNASL